MQRKSSQEETKKSETEIRRDEEGFLPKYSDRYFARIPKRRAIAGFVCGFIGIEAFLAAQERYFYSTGWNIVTFLCIAVVFYVIWPCRYVIKRKKMIGSWVRSTGIEQENFFGGTRMIPYAFYDEMLQRQKYYYKATCFQVGTGRNKLCFPYEIGNRRAKDHVQDVHKRLRPYLKEKLPVYYSCCGLLDRKYFYRKNRRLHSIILWIVMFLFLGLRPDITRLAQAGICGAILGVVMSIALYYIFKDAVLEQKVWEDLKKKLPDCWSHVEGNPYMGWIVFWLEAGAWLLADFAIVLYAGIE